MQADSTAAYNPTAYRQWLSAHQKLQPDNQFTWQFTCQH